ncbi:SEC-C metal-binding domain-containing protein [Pseudoduganella umbonata]|uniref:SEC-C domain-containing protein n=1 Tax=Pseudoduganella umbonata TaxID=864828 RepID=A0A7W5E732_9BURK|nr:SEC-C metal-binding domain-containing protein [Pseudoduganella umbonata]MBB3219899.1 hypothetical protein [Pseudoduganella umbonata]
MAKIGRNDQCPCGSGRKYKRCHGSSQVAGQVLHPTAELMLQRKLASEQQRRSQQGLGKPIISGSLGGRRLVAVRNRLLHAEGWRTFSDFLFDYIKMVLGPKWGTAELAKPIAERHPILVWYHYVCEVQTAHAVPGQIIDLPMTGAVEAYLMLAYDLYALDHNAELQEKLVARLRHPDQFAGARYEIFVAAALIRAGFALVFENEDDRQSTHCEFTATNTETGRCFSVEAKCRVSNGKFKLGRQLYRALKKEAKHERMVFIELNMPDAINEDEMLDEVNRAVAAIRASEGRRVEGEMLPSAYVLITNSPAHHHPTTQQVGSFVVAEGFQISDFKHDTAFPTVRAALDSRDRHREVLSIMGSLQTHRRPPDTFDGEIAEYAFRRADSAKRLLIGGRYPIACADGVERMATLTCTTVSEDESVVIGGVSFDDGSATVCNFPLSAAELDAWRRHPDTFFGTADRRKGNSGVLDIYDFFFHSCCQTPREQLLSLLADASDISALRLLSQPELASAYAERLTSSVIANHGAHD